jgi:putative ABC transport system ATP-binding protein
MTNSRPDRSTWILSTALRLTDVRFRYQKSHPEVVNIKSLTVDGGDTVFLHGPSGSGKTTLLSLVGGLFVPVAGKIEVLNQDITSLTASQRDLFRARNIGFIFQVFNLVPYLSVLDNVTLPCRFGRRVSGGFKNARDEALRLMSVLGISDFADRPVTQLSIGQQQRVAAARALIGSPGLIIADEPTSALDADARGTFLAALFEQARRESSTVIFVSHDRSLSTHFSRMVALADVNHAALKGGQVG